MEHVFWLIPRALAGRPGPNLEPWKLDELRSGGIRAVLSVNDGELCRAQDFAAVGLSYRCTPLSENAPPRPGDKQHCLEALSSAYEFVAAQLASARAVLVHCRSGKDRTGLFLAYYLTRAEGLEPAAAIAKVKEVRPIALSAEGWEAFAFEVLTAHESSDSPL